MKTAVLLELGGRFLFSAGPSRRSALRRVRGGLLGIALSLVPLVLVLEVASGMIEGISNRFLETLSYHVQMVGAGGYSAETLESLSEKLVREGLAKGAYPELQGVGLLRGPASSSGVQVRAVSPRLYAEDPGFRAYMRLTAGSFTLDSPSDIVVGSAIAQKLKLKIGDRLKLLTYRSDGWSGLPKISSFTVRGVVSSGYQELDRFWIFIPLERGTRVLESNNTRTLIGLKLVDPFQLPNSLSERGPQIEPAAGKPVFVDFDRFQTALNRSIGNHWLSYSWFDVQGGQLTQFLWTKNLLVFITAFIVLVAFVNVVSTMILMVVEKQYDLAMLKAMGSRPVSLGGLFLLMGGVIGSIGAVLGLFVGILVAVFINELIIGLEAVLNAGMRLFHWLSHGLSDASFQAIQLLNPEFYLERIPVRLHLGALALILLATIVLSVAASWIPARRAARLDPADLFRRL